MEIRTVRKYFVFITFDNSALTCDIRAFLAVETLSKIQHRCDVESQQYQTCKTQPE